MAYKQITYIISFALNDLSLCIEHGDLIIMFVDDTDTTDIFYGKILENFSELRFILQ